jgi:hypothetical protein
MLRYYAIATVIVVAIVVFATAWENRDLIRIRIASTTVPQSPKPAAALASHGGKQSVFRGDAPWALSALPECLRQRLEATGPIAFVRSKIPPDAVPVPPGRTLVYADCTILVGRGEILIKRGPDRLRIPPRVVLYQARDRLALLHVAGKAGELRIYEPTKKQ